MHVVSYDRACRLRYREKSTYVVNDDDNQPNRLTISRRQCALSTRSMFHGLKLCMACAVVSKYASGIGKIPPALPSGLTRVKKASIIDMCVCKKG
jgi:hypothetical protein